MTERIFIARADQRDALLARLDELDVSPTDARPRIQLYGCIPAGIITDWVGLEPVTEGHVNLNAPQPKDGDQPGTWMEYPSTDAVTGQVSPMHVNTSDLVVVKVTA